MSAVNWNSKKINDDYMFTAQRHLLETPQKYVYCDQWQYHCIIKLSLYGNVSQKYRLIISLQKSHWEHPVACFLSLVFGCSSLCCCSEHSELTGIYGDSKSDTQVLHFSGLYKKSAMVYIFKVPSNHIA